MKSLYISKQISDIRKSFKEPLGGKSVKISDCWTFSLFEPRLQKFKHHLRSLPFQPTDPKKKRNKNSCTRTTRMFPLN